MTSREMLSYIEEEAIRPGELDEEALREEREIMRQVKALGVPPQGLVDVQKAYRFICQKCGEICITVSDSDLKKYQRVWALLKLVKSVPLTDGQIAEIIDLCAQDYRYIGVYCHNEECNSEFEWIITNEEEWAEHLKYVEIGYEIVEAPKMSGNVK